MRARKGAGVISSCNLGSDIESTVQALSEWLRIHKCVQLHLSFSPSQPCGHGRTTVWGSCLGPKPSAAARSQVTSPPPAPTNDAKGGSSSSTRTHPVGGTQQGHVWVYDQWTHSWMECLGSTLQISFFFLIFIEIQLIYNVVLVSGVPWSDPVLCINDIYSFLCCHPSHAIIGEGNGNPLQYSCLGNPTDRGAWQASAWGCKELDTT